MVVHFIGRIFVGAAPQHTYRLFLEISRYAEMILKLLETPSPPIMKQILPLVEQLPPLYMDLVKGRQVLIPKRLESIDETSILAHVLGVESSISSKLDMSIRTLRGDRDHGLPLQQALTNVPPAMADAVTQWESMAKEVGGSVGSPSCRHVQRCCPTRPYKRFLDVFKYESKT